MDDLRNPYSPGAGSRPPAIVGREQELQLFSTAIGRLAIGRSAKSLMLTGLRGVGKTVLLNEFALIAGLLNRAGLFLFE
jgi:predicted AAA+ superfamily ATPase